MTAQEVIDVYAPLDSRSKVRFLATTASNLTIGMRGLYDSTEGSDQLIKRFQGANELHHHLSSELQRHHAEDAKRYPDDVLINILVEKATHYCISGELGYALKRAMEADYRQNSPHSTV